LILVGLGVVPFLFFVPLAKCPWCFGLDRSCEGCGRPEGWAFAQVKAMGSAAYPRLVRYIDHENIMTGKAAVRALHELTGRDGPLPSEATKHQMKSNRVDWMRTSR